MTPSFSAPGRDPSGRYGANNRVSDRLLTTAFEKVMRCFG
jgi:hypothetical protein